MTNIPFDRGAAILNNPKKPDDRDFRFSITAGTYNLGQNKMRNNTTPPPDSVIDSRENQNAPFFNFCFEMSKIVGRDKF